MSLQQCNRTHRRTVINLKKSATLILTQELLLKIHYFHHRVRSGAEWSGILKYDVESGDMKDPENWILKAHDLILMDEGTAGYTEYEYDPQDAYSWDQVQEAMENEKPLGHIHTHHNMGAFFSGTDTSELHDNAPNHAFYLSLIVNYKEPDKWVAKVAICGELTEKGTIKQNSMFSFLKKGKNKTVQIDKKTPVLYLIDCNIEVEESAKEFQGRLEVLREKKRKEGGNSWSMHSYPSRQGNPMNHYRHGHHNQHVGHSSQNNNIHKLTESHNRNASVGKSSPARENVSTGVKQNSQLRSDLKYSKRAVEGFLIALQRKVAPYHTMRSSEGVFSLIEHMNPSIRDTHLEDMENKFEEVIKSHFKLEKVTPLDTHCIVAALLVHNSTTAKGSYLWDTLEDLAAIYLIEEQRAPEKEVVRLTGVTSSQLIETWSSFGMEDEDEDDTEVGVVGAAEELPFVWNGDTEA